MWSGVKKVVQQPKLIISGIEALGETDDAQLKARVTQADRDLRSVQTQEDRVIGLYVTGKISEAHFDRQRKVITERVEGLRAKLDDSLNAKLDDSLNAPYHPGLAWRSAGPLETNLAPF